jgi:hypothetical protein
MTIVRRTCYNTEPFPKQRGFTSLPRVPYISGVHFHDSPRTCLTRQHSHRHPTPPQAKTQLLHTVAAAAATSHLTLVTSITQPTLSPPQTDAHHCPFRAPAPLFSPWPAPHTNRARRAGRRTLQPVFRRVPGLGGAGGDRNFRSMGCRFPPRSLARCSERPTRKPRATPPLHSRVGPDLRRV